MTPTSLAYLCLVLLVSLVAFAAAGKFYELSYLLTSNLSPS